jgi:putative hydrolase of the HAD superfamily
MPTITAIFFDIGGVCLSNGWDHEQRQVVAQKLGFDYAAFDSRHRQVIDSLERGHLTLDEYLKWTLFYMEQPFTLEQTTEEIRQLSTPFTETLEVVRALRASKRYLLATLNNESRELNEYRIERFGLRELFSVFFSSCYLGLIKPQPDAYRRAFQITQCRPDECIFVDDRPMNVEVARILGMHAIQFTSAAQLVSDLRESDIVF